MTPQAERGGRSSSWSIASGVLSLLLLALQTPFTEFAGLRAFDRLQVALGARSNTIVAAWVLLLSALVTAVLAIVFGLRGTRTSSASTVRLGRIGWLLGVLSIGGIVIWQLCGGFFALFWGP